MQRSSIVRANDESAGQDRIHGPQAAPAGVRARQGTGSPADGDEARRAEAERKFLAAEASREERAREWQAEKAGLRIVEPDGDQSSSLSAVDSEREPEPKAETQTPEVEPEAPIVHESVATAASDVDADVGDGQDAPANPCIDAGVYFMCVTAGSTFTPRFERKKDGETLLRWCFYLTVTEGSETGTELPFYLNKPKGERLSTNSKLAAAWIAVMGTRPPVDLAKRDPATWLSGKVLECEVATVEKDWQGKPKHELLQYSKVARVVRCVSAIEVDS